jgi:hypothetical protein
LSNSCPKGFIFHLFKYLFEKSLFKKLSKKIGYTCDPKQETCQLNDEKEQNVQETIKIINSRVKNSEVNKRSIKLVVEQDDSVECSDSVHYCPDNYTCCPTSGYILLVF